MRLENLFKIGISFSHVENDKMKIADAHAFIRSMCLFWNLNVCSNL